MNIQHSSRTDEWGTPPDIIAAVHEVLGCIDLDPCSSEKWNQTVRAGRYFDRHVDGLSQYWYGNVFCNPPGGKAGNKSLSGLFWSKLMSERCDEVRHAIFLAYSIESLQSTQKPGQPSILDFTICVPRRRLRFVSSGVEKRSPSHSSVIVYVPGVVDLTESFIQVFSKFGVCN